MCGKHYGYKASAFKFVKYFHPGLIFSSNWGTLEWVCAQLAHKYYARVDMFSKTH
jgi:hypothetical protein